MTRRRNCKGCEQYGTPCPACDRIAEDIADAKRGRAA